jgi:hypothetical protein
MQVAKDQSTDFTNDKLKDRLFDQMNARLKVKYEAEVKIGEVKSMDTGKLMEMARGD